MDNNTNLLSVLRTLFQWKWTILIVAVATFIGTAAISLLLPNYFKASTVFYAASEDLAKPEVLFAERGSGIRSEYYGSENDIDRLLTVAQSNELKDYLIDTFQLFEHYKMNPDAPKAKFRLRKKINKYYDIIKTERSAIQLSFEDKDPAFAAKVANAARVKIESIALAVIRANQAKSIGANEENLASKGTYLQEMADSMAYLRKVYGIYDGLEQAKDLSDLLINKKISLTSKSARLDRMKQISGVRGIKDSIAYLEAEINGLNATVDTLSNRLEHWRNGMAAVLDVEKQYYDVAQALSEDRERTRILKATYTADVPAVLVVEEAEVPLYKSRPRRSILVLAATFIVTCFTMLGILLFESYKGIDWKSIINA